MLYLILGLVTAFNFLILKYKIERSRYIDALYDLVAILILSSIFAGTLGGMIIAMTASLVISLYLLKFPPLKPVWDKEKRKITWKA